MDMVERVARAIGMETCGDAPGYLDELIQHPAAKSWEPPSMPRWHQWTDHARAAIEAMREPTAQQMRTASMTFPPWGGHGEASAPSQADMWRAMIDAALSEAKG